MTTKTLEPKERQFKNTEIGAIPYEWDLVSFGEAFDFLRTASFSREQLGSVGDVQYIHYGDVHTKWNYYVDLSKVRIPTIDSSMGGRYTKIRNGDLVVVDASEDYVGLSKSVEVTGLSEKEAISGLHTFLLRDKGGNFVDGYRGYITSSPLVKRSLDRYATGMKVFGVSKTNLKLVLIPRPPTKEQEAIVTALRDTDNLIESLEKLIAKKRAIKQGAMQELLTGKRRLPGFTDRWVLRKLGDIAELVMGQSPSSVNYNTKGIGLPLIQGNADIDQRRTIPRIFTTQVTKRCRRGDLIMTVRAPVGQVARAEFDACLGRGVCAIRFHNDFLYHCLIRQETKWLQLSKGSTFDAVNSDDIRKLDIHLPDDESEQVAISNSLSAIDKDIDSVILLLSKYRQLKQGMMQSLLTGKIRLTA